MKTQVGIIGAGPAGLFLSHMLDRAGISSVVLENRSREYIEARTRAAVLEQKTMNVMDELGLGKRMHELGIMQEGIELRFAGERFRLPLTDLTDGNRMTFYSQQEVVKDLIAARVAEGGQILFEATDANLLELESQSPKIEFTYDGRREKLECDFIAGCDGFHGVSRLAIPSSKLRGFDQALPFAWLGILANVPPSTKEVIFARHERGFAMHSIRPGGISRLYLQVDPKDTIEPWTDRRIWDELHTRFALKENWTLAEGPILDKTIIQLHSFVAEPMQHGRLFLAGDAAHIVPPVAAKGLNLAVADVRQLSRSLSAHYRENDDRGLENYSQTALKRVWQTMAFSWEMSEMMHRMSDSAYQDRVQISKLRYIQSSPAAARAFADNYFGLTHE